jgi:hypothetical protein
MACVGSCSMGKIHADYVQNKNKILMTYETCFIHFHDGLRKHETSVKPWTI